MLDPRKLLTTLLLLSGILVLVTGVFVMFLLRASLVEALDTSISPPKNEETYTNLNNGKHRIDFGFFSIDTPKEFVFYRKFHQGQFEGILTDFKDTLQLRYGRAVNTLKGLEYTRSRDTISGIPAITAYLPHQGAVIYFSSPSPYASLSIISPTIAREKAFSIFQSIDFPHKDGLTTAPLGLRPEPQLYRAEQYFVNNCTVCHSLSNEVIVGPGLHQVMERGDTAWFTSWVLEPQAFIQREPKAAALFEKYNKTVHPTYTFSKEEIRLLILYIDAYQAIPRYDVLPNVMSCLYEGSF